jgi:phosphoglycolate phosphatase
MTILTNIVRRRIRGILFDKDGTLFKFASTWVPVYLECAKRLSYGNKMLEDELIIKAGIDREKGTIDSTSVFSFGTIEESGRFWLSIVQKYHDMDLHEIIVAMEAVFQTLGVEHSIEAVENMSEFFRHLKCDLGLALGVVTCDSYFATEKTLKRHNIFEFFDFIAGFDNWPPKPDPTSIRAFVEQTGIDPAEIVVIGDTPRDLYFARNGEVRYAIGVLTGAFSREKLEPLADSVLESIGQLESHLRKLDAL